MRLIVILLLMTAALSEARDRTQIYKFRATHPCPVTKKTTGACKDWVVDHVIPLCAGGKDIPANMQWQPRAKSYEKDKIEIAYCHCMSKILIACR